MNNEEFESLENYIDDLSSDLKKCVDKIYDTVQEIYTKSESLDQVINVLRQEVKNG